MILPPYDLNDNVFRLLDKDWMLITAGTKEKYNTMTASWGGFGILWNKPVSFIFIRPTRYTYEFANTNPYYTLSFFNEKYRKALNILGSRSGRDTDKVKISGLTPFSLDSGNVSFREARLIMECKKFYYQDLDPKQFLVDTIEKNYPGKDYHRMYIGEIQMINNFSI